MKLKRTYIILFIFILVVLGLLGIQSEAYGATSDYVIDYMEANKEIGEDEWKIGLNLYSESQEKNILEKNPDKNHMTVVTNESNGVFKEASKYYISTTNTEATTPTKDRIKPESSHWLQMTVNDENSEYFRITYGKDGSAYKATQLTKAQDTKLTIRYKNVRKICIYGW